MNVNLQATPELVPLIEGLGTDTRFQRLMEILEARCTGLAVAAHSFPDETHRLWAGGRVQELADLLKLYHQRHDLVRGARRPEPSNGF